MKKEKAIKILDNMLGEKHIHMSDDNMKVKIIQRSVYHKIAEVEVKVPNDWRKYDGDDNYYTHINDYLFDNDHLYTEKMDEKISNAKYEFGFGLGDGMEEVDQASEWRYDVEGENYGGHL